MSQRSILRVRQQPHVHPDRRDEIIIEVVRDGEVAATIYGSREGVHIVSERWPHNRAFSIEGALFKVPGLAVALLKADETCPWCGRKRPIPEGETSECPVCKPL